jgi:squalene-hopene/tetraprenyl-beta-curcumene cyclase
MASVSNGIDLEAVSRTIDTLADRTFSVPILTVLALAGKLGRGGDAWRLVPQLPFELAACPHQWFRWLHLPVVSYALPALVAMGHVRHHRAPTRLIPLAFIRSMLRPVTLRVARDMQPYSGGFLEAVPLTAFVVMSLTDAGSMDDPVVTHGVRFLRASVRADGSWPIDTNLATWVTTLSVDALDATGRLPLDDGRRILDWLLEQQSSDEHPFTHAAAGGWGWTNLSGSVPDADDTSAALIAVATLGRSSAAERDRLASGSRRDSPAAPSLRDAATAGIKWLLDLQNGDGGIPTFCRGWGALPFDRSAPDLTAHAVKAWVTWSDVAPLDMRDLIAKAEERALAYLAGQQRADGSWVPLWFGNEHVKGEVNPTYGTARVVAALSSPGLGDRPDVRRCCQRGVEWLLDAQGAQGGWGGDAGTPATLEETGLALQAVALGSHLATRDRAMDALVRGCRWLIEASNEGRTTPPAPIGLYFARLWYYEELYPLIFSLKGLTHARTVLAAR